MAEPALERTAFTTSRQLEFFGEKELQMQIGHDRRYWPVALLKELIDNALDACEAAGVAPVIRVTVDADAVTVADNGPGLPEAVLRRSLDYTTRTSDKAYYVSPTRGQMGNALKCIYGAAFVLMGERAVVEVAAQGLSHRINVTLDRISQEPRLRLESAPAPTTGTVVKIRWPGIARLLATPERDSYTVPPPTVAQLLQDYAAFNSHAAFVLEGVAGRAEFQPTVPGCAKWKPSDPTSPHWYTPERLRALIAAYLGEERSGQRGRTVREFVSEFRGLSGSAKQKAVTDAAGLTGAWLRDLVDGDDVAACHVARLLEAMQVESRPVKPDALGPLGEAHLTDRMVTSFNAAPDSVRYKKLQGETDGVPYVLEVAFGVYRAAGGWSPGTVAVGLNWTPTIRQPLVKLAELLGANRVDGLDPVAVVVHLACPRLEFTDRGKSALALSGPVLADLEKGLEAVTKEWKRLKQRKARDARVAERDLDELRRAERRREWSRKEAAYAVMAEAYQKASNGGRLPVNARQLMYAVRPGVLALTGGKFWKDSRTFTQDVLQAFMEDYPVETAAWDVTFDDRGHFGEPHTGRRIGLGTVAVRVYVAKWNARIAPSDPVELDYEAPTLGPANRYRYALFIEKEGFNPLLKAAQIAERFDLAVMSTKGMSVTAARQLIDHLSAAGVTILVLRDFDKSGFSIVRTLAHNTRRYTFTTPPRVIDLGLRLADVRALGLEGEHVTYKGKADPRPNLRQNGATAEEIAYLVRSRDRYSGEWKGERVELNAMPPPQFVTWLEDKLQAAGVTKVVPTGDALADAYRRAVRLATIQKAIDDAEAAYEGAPVEVPADLEETLREKVNGTATAWDEALWEMAREALEEAEAENE